ncbi:MAG: hypothetical protein ACFFCQ_14450 [Promethearchaeota archaeon]
MVRIIAVIGIILFLIGIIGVGVWFVTSNQGFTPGNITLSGTNRTDSAHIATTTSLSLFTEVSFEFNLQDMDTGQLTVSMYVINAGDTFDIAEVTSQNLVWEWPTINAGDNGIHSISSAVDKVGDVYIYFNYTGAGSTITITDMEAKVNWLLPAIIGGISTLLGIVLILISLLRGGREPRVAARPMAQPLYEPSLGIQTSSFSATSTTSTTKKKKKAPTASACPYCGKTVDSSLIYCPHCYSKMK